MADNQTAAQAHDIQPDEEALLTTMADPSHVGLRQAGMDSQYRSQDIYQLISVFIAEARKVLPCDGIEYNEDTLGLSFIDGDISHYRCDYTIRLGEQLLGEIGFSREKEFQDHELVVIEDLIAGLALPLRNAFHYQKAIRFALRDRLTGLRNGNAYYDNIALEIERARRYKLPFSLLLVNLDNFSEINQRYGREAGNAVLVEVAARLENDARNSDIIFRKGGDEFLVFLPNTVKSAAKKAAERIKKAVLSAPCAVESIDIHFSTSIGVVTVLPDDSAFTIIERADKALYHAKILGKNRIQVQPGTESLFQE